jgi:hypothetical protein
MAPWLVAKHVAAAGQPPNIGFKNDRLGMTGAAGIRPQCAYDGAQIAVSDEAGHAFQ